MGCFVMHKHIREPSARGMVHALCEVIERNAMACSTMPAAMQETRSLDLRTVEESECRRHLDLYDRAGVAVGVWDATCRVRVPMRDSQ